MSVQRPPRITLDIREAEFMPPSRHSIDISSHTWREACGTLDFPTEDIDPFTAQFCSSPAHIERTLKARESIAKAIAGKLVDAVFSQFDTQMGYPKKQ